MNYNILFHSRLLKLSLFLYDFRAASPKENVESSSLLQIKPVKFIATRKFIEPHSTKRIQSLIQNPYLRKWSLHLRQYSIYRLHCITNTNDISIHHIYDYRVNIFRDFFFLEVDGVCLPACGKTRLLQPAEAGGILPPATRLFGMSSGVTNRPPAFLFRWAESHLALLQKSVLIQHIFAAARSVSLQ